MRRMLLKFDLKKDVSYKLCSKTNHFISCFNIQVPSYKNFKIRYTFTSIGTAISVTYSQTAMPVYSVFNCLSENLKQPIYVLTGFGCLFD